MKVFFRKSHFEGTHRDQGTDRTAVSESQFCDFSILPEIAVDTVLFYGHTEHQRSTGTVDVVSFHKYFGTPGLTGEVCKDSGFNSREVADDELISGTGNEGGSDKFRQD